MKRTKYHVDRLLAGLLALLLVGSATSPSVFGFEDEDRIAKFIAQTPPRTPSEQQEMFRLPPGFRIELVASEPEVIKPINMNFDAAGRLYVTQSVEYPFPAPADRTGHDTIKRIIDADRNGVPDKVTTFADGLSIPIGVTPIHDGVLGYSIPNVYHFSDTNNDGHADRKTLAYTQFGAADTHGMVNGLTWWIDGWVYGCHGFANTSTVKGADSQAITMSSGNTYRVRPDGSHIEYYTHGQVNPFGISFDELGNLFTADCHTKPLYMLVRGAYYPSFGKPHDGLGFGPEMMKHLHGSTGIAGVVYYAASHFPSEYRDTLFVGNPITGRVNHDRIERHGSTYKAIEQPDFLRCDDPWFRPVDLQVGLDGSLYIADFYNRVIGHYEVPLTHPLRDKERGRIWRVSYIGDSENSNKQAAAIDLTKMSADQFLAALGHDDLQIRTHATHQLVHRIGAECVGKLRRMLSAESTPAQRAHGLWVLERLGALDDATVGKLADDESRMVRVHLVKLLAERTEWQTQENTLVLNALQDDDPFVSRAAADALGRHPRAEHVAPLLALWTATPTDDELLIHTTRIALRDSIRHLKNLPELAKQFEENHAVQSQLAEIALGIGSADAAAYLLDFEERHRSDGTRGEQALEHVARHLDEAMLPRLFQLAGSYQSEQLGRQLSILRALNRSLRSRGIRMPESIVTWADHLAKEFLASDDANRVRRGIEFAQELTLISTAQQLATLAGDDSPHRSLRTQAADALVTVDPPLAVTIIAKLLADPKSDATIKRQAAEALGRLNSAESRGILLDLLRVAPEPLALTIGRSLSSSREGASSLLGSIEKGLASAQLLRDTVIEQRVLAARILDVQQRVAALLDGLPPGDERINQLIASRKTGFQKAKPDSVKGAALFKKHCAACHQIGGTGNKVGPELDGIGLRGRDRLLEDLLDPNRNVDANFRASIIVLESGRVFNGLVLREEGQTLVAVDDKGKPQRIPLNEIEERKQMKLSPMPANVSELLKEDEFYDLLGFLLAQQRKVAPKRPKDR